MEYSQNSSRSFSLVSSHEPSLSVFDYQRLCNVLAGYKFTELLVLRENLGCRVLESAVVGNMYLPPSTNSRNTPYVCSTCMPYYAAISPLFFRHLKGFEIGPLFLVVLEQPSTRVHLSLHTPRSQKDQADFLSSCAY